MVDVFISYRRSDSGPHAGRLHDRLVKDLGAPHTFIDVAAIEPGADFMARIQSTMEHCGVVLVLVGPTWADVAHEDGTRRLHDPADAVRIEVLTALSLGKRVIPVLVGGACMPAVDRLPVELAGLARLEAFALLDDRWHSDVDRLAELIRADEHPARWTDRAHDRLAAWTGPRSYLSAVMMAGFPMGLAWGACMAWLASDDGHVRYIDALTAILPTATAVGLVFGLAMGVLTRGARVDVSFVDRAQFLARMQLAMTELTYAPVPAPPGVLVYRPSFAAGWLAGRITVHLGENRATFIGPNRYVRRVVRQLR